LHVFSILKSITRFSNCDNENNGIRSIRLKKCGDYEIKKTKLVHFVRHGEGYHNVAGKIDRSNYLKEEYADCALTENGIIQCENLRNTAVKNQYLLSADLLLVSPLRRALETAYFSFSFLQSGIKWIALEELRETTGLHPCDRRSSISKTRTLFPFVNFDELTHDQDPLYDLYSGRREPDEEVMKRGFRFVQWLNSRDEQNIVIVTHSAFLKVLFHHVFEVDDIDKVWYENCECRSYYLLLSDDENAIV